MTHLTKKADIAAEYLRDSISLWRSGHYYSALTLAGAADEILGKYIEYLPANFASIRLTNRSALNTKVVAYASSSPMFGMQTTEKQIRDQLLKPKNSAKHYGVQSEDSVDFDSQFEAGELILNAISNYRMVFPDAQDHFEYEEEDIHVAQSNRLSNNWLPPSDES
jgi:hypothetical protein